MQNWPVALADAELRRATDPGSFERGSAYARAGHVEQWSYRADSQTLIGTVRGNGSKPYVTTIDLSAWEADAGRPRARAFASRCTCPVGGGCKHAVAVMLVARDQHAETPTGRNLRLVRGSVRDGEGTGTAPATWESSVSALLPRDAGAAAPTAPLGLQFEVKTGVIRTFGDAASGRADRLLVRPVSRGRSGAWIRSAITWHDLRSAALHLPFDGEHVEALRELADLESTTYTYSATPTIDLGLVRRSVWEVLASVRDAGVALVTAARTPRPVHLHEEPARLSLDLTRPDGSSDLRLRTRIQSGEVSFDPTEVRLLGNPAHGFFTAGDDGALVLAPLERTLNLELQQFVERVGALDIPAADVSRFLTSYWPKLRRAVPVISADHSVHLPEVSGPRLHLRITFEGSDSADLEWSITYVVDGQERHHPLGRVAGREDLRDRQAEDRLTKGTRLPEQPIALRSFGQLVPEQHLRGLEVLELTQETLPRLREVPELDLEIVGEEPTFRFTETPPLVTLSAADTPDADWFDLGVRVSIEGEAVPFRRLFEALARGQTTMVLDSGTWFRLDRPELETLRLLIEEARDLSDQPAGQVKISPFQVGLWEELIGLGVVEEQSQRWSTVVGGLLALDEMPTPQPPDGLHAQLRPYQLNGYRWLRFLHDHSLGGILADDMGLGKTVQTLALASAARAADPDAPPFLVVAPTSVVANWAAEAARFTPDLRVVAIGETEKRRKATLASVTGGADLVVTSYALFRIDEAAYQAQPWSALLLDEAQFVKNHQAKTYQCARRLQAPFKLAITGTPLENNLMDLWSLLSIVAPGLYPSPERFAEVYAKPIERGHRRAELLASLRRRVRPLMLRRTKEEVATELPPKQETVLPIRLNARHRRVYDTHLHRERQKILRLIDEDPGRNRFTILRSLTLLRQLALDPALVDADHDTVGSAKIDALLEMLSDVVGEGHRALVFSQFTSFLARVRTRLDAAGIGHAYLDGSTRHRQREIDAFKDGDAPVFVISLKAGGFGLNLTEADYVFVLDPWWNPATEAQAVDRTHRIGQTRRVMVYRLVSQDTIETKVMELKQRKEALFASVMSEDGGFGGALSADDIRGLFS
jgi:superfamily II DNA or RNA helicase